MMKIEIVSGTKKEPACGKNTIITIDGKEIKGINYCWIKANIGETTKWCIGFK